MAESILSIDIGVSLSFALIAPMFAVSRLAAVVRDHVLEHVPVVEHRANDGSVVGWRVGGRATNIELPDQRRRKAECCDRREELELEDGVELPQVRRN